jgi:hypothetical protein
MARDAEFRARITVDGADQAEAQLDDLAQVASDLEEPVELDVKSDLSRVLSDLESLSSEMRATTQAADTLGQALGPELSSKADLTTVVTELRSMGLTFDDIEGNADQLAAKLRELAAADVGGSLGQSLGTARGETEKLSDSARGANSALANMVGNTAQDLGALGGVAGSAGVAIGQMAEYMSDATLGGEALGSALKSMATVAGPVAALGIAMQLVSSQMDAMRKGQEATKAFHTDQIEAFTDALREGGDAAENYSKHLADTGQIIASTGQKAGPAWAKIIPGVSDVTGALGVLGRYGDVLEDLTRTLDKAGISAERWSQIVTSASPVQAMNQLRTATDQMNLSDDERADILTGARAAQEDYAKAQQKAAIANRVFGESADSVNEILQDTLAQADPLAQFTDLWDRLFADMADGTIDAQGTAAAVDLLADNLGMTREQVIGLAQEHLDDEFQKQADAAEEAAKAAADYTIKLAGTQTTIDQLGDAFGEMGRNADAISQIFALGDAPLEAASDVRDISEAIGGLGDAAKGIDLSKPLDPANLKADKLLDALDQLRPQIQQRITDAFATGGPAAAQATADSYVNQIVQALHGQLTADEVRSLLGLDDLEAKIRVAVDRSALDQAKASLDALTGLTGETPWTATIRMALDAGDISPDAAQSLINAQLAGAGVDIPSSLQPPSDAGQTLVEAATWARDHPVDIPTTADPSGAAKDVSGWAKGKQPTATIPTDANTKPAEDERRGFVQQTESTKPVVTVDANTKAAISTMLYLKILSGLLQPVVTVTANTNPARLGIWALTQMRPTVPVTAYLSDYPSAGTIANRIGTVRVPVDAYVRSTPRISGNLGG